jgi:hypothetical protein
VRLWQIVMQRNYRVRGPIAANSSTNGGKKIGFEQEHM